MLLYECRWNFLREGLLLNSNQGFISVGYENYIDSRRIVAVLNVGSSPAKKLIHKIDEAGGLIDVTSGRKRKSAILLDSNHVFLTAKNPVTIIKGLFEGNDG